MMTSATREELEPIPWGPLGALVILAFALRAIGLNDGLWYDEIRTLVDSVRSPLSTIVTVFPGNNQHSFFSVLARISVVVFGEENWSLRLPAMLFGVASVPMLYRFAREFLGRTESMAACLLLAVDYYHIWFSQNARGYSILMFVTILCSWLLLLGLRHRRLGYFVWYAVAAALGVYTHLTMVFLVVSHAVLIMLPIRQDVIDKTRPGWWKLPWIGFVLSAAFTIVLYLPVLLEVQQFFVDRPSPRLVATPGWALVELLRALNIGAGAGAWLLFRLALLGLGFLSYLKKDRFMLGLFILPGIVMVGVTLVLQRPVFPRFVFFLMGFGILVMTRGALEVASWIDRRRSAGGMPSFVPLVAIMALVSASTLLPNYRYPKQDFVGALDYVDRERMEGEPVVTVGLTRFVYREYLKRPWVEVDSADGLAAVRAGGRKVWVVYTLSGYIRSTTPDLMETLDADCRIASVFRSTLRNGDVTVCAIAASPPAP